MADLTLTHASVAVANTPLVRDASLRIKQGEFTVLLGPNGAGKTSLLRLALGLVKTNSGQVTLDGTAVDQLSPSLRARSVAYLPQHRPLSWPNRVRDVVALGRFTHGAVMGKLKMEDATAVDAALRACGLQAFASRSADTLSGGELARMHCARAFAANTPLLLADEPTAALDPLHQHQVLQLLRGYVDDGGGACVVLHDISLAARYADRLVWMKDGQIVSVGSVTETLTAERMRDVYGVEARIDTAGAHLQVAVLGPA